MGEFKKLSNKMKNSTCYQNQQNILFSKKVKGITYFSLENLLIDSFIIVNFINMAPWDVDVYSYKLSKWKYFNDRT